MGPAAIDATGPELSEAILGSGIVQNTECDHAGQQHFDNRFVLSTTDANHLIYTKGTQQQTRANKDAHAVLDRKRDWVQVSQEQVSEWFCSGIN